MQILSSYLITMVSLLCMFSYIYSSNTAEAEHSLHIHIHYQ